VAKGIGFYMQPGVTPVSETGVATETLAQSSITVFGHLDARTITEIDQVADQMLMPRSWVVTQILREWSERRTIELHELEESWNGSYREEAGEKALEGPCEDCRPI
jgi:predicted transcriptional regulator